MNTTIGAIEAGGTKFVLALASREGAILERTRIATAEPDETTNAIRAFFDAASERHGPFAAFGIGSFGPIAIDLRSPEYGRFGATPKRAWVGWRWQEALGRYDVPLVIDSDVNAAALGEWTAGSGRGCDTVAYTTVGTGIGSGVLHEGRSVMGIGHMEAGHIRVQHDRLRDPFEGMCPYHGDCLEGLASGPAIKARWGESLDVLAHRSPASVELIADYLADLAVALVLLHMPDRLIFGGGVMKAQGLLEALRQATESKLGGYISHERLDAGLRRYIVGPELGDDAGIIGAIALAHRAPPA